MMKTKIVVFEPNMNSSPHSEINAGLLSIFEKVWISSDKIFYADNRHVDSIRKKKVLKQWFIVNVKIFDYTPFLFLINDLLQVLKLRKILKTHYKDKTFFIFLGTMPLSNIFLSQYNKRYKRNIIVCLHGQMEAYLENTKIGFSRIYYRLSQSVFKQSDFLKYIVFGQSIKDNTDFLFRNNKKIIVLDQPYLYPQIEEKINNSNVITLGFIGRADKTKNIGELYILIDSLRNYIIDGRVEIKVVGRFNYDIPNKYKNLFTYYTSILDPEKFQKEIESINFAISFTGKEFYRATPSGTFFDCVKWEIPLLTLENDFTNYYFKKYGAMGKSFSNVKEMGSWIKSELLEKNINDNSIKLFKECFKKLKKDLSIELLSEKLANQL